MKVGIRFLVLALTLAAPGGSAAAERVLTPRDVVTLSQVEEIALSPDGETVAYALEVPREPGEDEDGRAWQELHVVDAGGLARPYVSGQVRVSAVAWTPDGGAVTFLSQRQDDDHVALWAIPLAGGEARRLAALASDMSSYALCSDGRRLALVGEEPEDEKRRELREKGYRQEIFEEDWRPARLWVTTLGENDGMAAVGEPLAVAGSVVEAVWSPSCDRLAVALAPTPLVDDRLMASRLRVVDPGSGRVLAAIDNPGKLGDFAWSGDGSRLAMIAAADAHDPREGRLMVAPASGGELRDLLPDLAGHVMDFAWSGKDRLTFLVHEGTGARLGEVDAGGGGETTRFESRETIFTDLSLAAAGAAALAGSAPAHPAEVFLLGGGRQAARRLTDSNPWLAETRLAPQEVVRYRARDGLELEGLLVRPLAEERGRRYPLIVVVHGGPESHFSNGWLTSYARPGQTGAARGFAVFYPNYRGSTGRGVAFSKLDHGDPAGKEFDDLVDGVDFLIAQGLVDGDRVAITGGSYGGYATAWGATYYSERFAAAVMAWGISEKIAKFGTSDIPNELYMVHERRWPWEDFQLALERSPAYYVTKARTPILILHGEEDARVFPGQGRILYRFLKILGQAPVRLVLYPGEPHGLRRTAARLDFSLRQLRWIEHYLLGPGGEPPSWEIDYPPAPEED